MSSWIFFDVLIKDRSCGSLLGTIGHPCISYFTLCLDCQPSVSVVVARFSSVILSIRESLLPKQNAGNRQNSLLVGWHHLFKPPSNVPALLWFCVDQPRLDGTQNASKSPDVQIQLPHWHMEHILARFPQWKTWFPGRRAPVVRILDPGSGVQ